VAGRLRADGGPDPLPRGAARPAAGLLGVRPPARLPLVAPSAPQPPRTTPSWLPAAKAVQTSAWHGTYGSGRRRSSVPIRSLQSRSPPPAGLEPEPSESEGALLSGWPWDHSFDRGPTAKRVVRAAAHAGRAAAHSFGRGDPGQPDTRHLGVKLLKLGRISPRTELFVPSYDDKQPFIPLLLACSNVCAAV
jgi:hypothetical protein